MQTRKRRILFAEQYYYPEGWGGAVIPRDLTQHLQRLGYEVEVICGSDQYAAVEGPPEPDPAAAGIRIRRIPRILGGGPHRLKLLRQLWFYVAVVPLLFFRRRPDLFITQTNPPLIVVAMAFAAWFMRRPLLVIAQDLYPETLFAHFSMAASSRRARLLTFIFDTAYRCALRVVVLGPVMARRVLAKGVGADRIVEISNWSVGTPEVVRGERNSLRAAWGLAGKFVLLYAGNIGIGHEFETLLDGFEQAQRKHDDLILVFIGRGKRLAELRESVRRRGLEESVIFRDFVPTERLPESLGLADLAVVTLRPGFEGLIVPSKMLGYMARGIPVLYVGPHSDTECLVRQAECGFVVGAADVAGVAQAISSACCDRAGLERRGAAGRAAYERSLTREHAMDKYRQLVSQCLAV